MANQVTPLEQALANSSSGFNSLINVIEGQVNKFDQNQALAQKMQMEQNMAVFQANLNFEQKKKALTELAPIELNQKIKEQKALGDIKMQQNLDYAKAIDSSITQPTQEKQRYFDVLDQLLKSREQTQLSLIAHSGTSAKAQQDQLNQYYNRWYTSFAGSVSNLGMPTPTLGMGTVKGTNQTDVFAEINSPFLPQNLQGKPISFNNLPAVVESYLKPYNDVIARMKKLKSQGLLNTSTTDGGTMKININGIPETVHKKLIGLNDVNDILKNLNERNFEYVKEKLQPFLNGTARFNSTSQVEKTIASNKATILNNDYQNLKGLINNTTSFKYQQKAPVLFTKMAPTAFGYVAQMTGVGLDPVAKKFNQGIGISGSRYYEVPNYFNSITELYKQVNQKAIDEKGQPDENIYKNYAHAIEEIMKNTKYTGADFNNLYLNPNYDGSNDILITSNQMINYIDKQYKFNDYYQASQHLQQNKTNTAVNLINTANKMQ